MKLFSQVAVLFFLTLYCVPASQADEIYTFVVKKQEEKAKNRWSLSEWLETRDKMRLMDLWLALHSPSPYEFFFGGAYRSGEVRDQGSYSGWDLQAAAYASIFGLGFEREGRTGFTDTHGLFLLRIFGFHAQATNITLHGGVKVSDWDVGDFRGAVAGVSSNIYIGKYFGLEGLFRHSFDSATGPEGAKLSGDRYEGGAFIDFKFLRVYGKYFSDQSRLQALASDLGSTTTGIAAGAKMFF